jgi:hypothetical protein
MTDMSNSCLEYKQGWTWTYPKGVSVSVLHFQMVSPIVSFVRNTCTPTRAYNIHAVG